MRKTPLIAAALFVCSGAGAQDYGADCRGETMRDLARCAAERAPAPQTPSPEAEEIAPLNPRRVDPSSLGGALQPSNLRRDPPMTGRSSVPLTSADTLSGTPPVVDPLRGLADDPTSPLYGIGRTDAERRRMLDPLAGTGLRGFGGDR